MKIKHFLPLTLLLCLACSLKTFGQQANQQILLKLTDPATKTSKTYVLNSMVYSYGKPSGEGSASCSINIDFKQDMDSFLLKWVAGEFKKTEGVITLDRADMGKLPRTIAFKGATAANTVESFASADSSPYGQISLSVETLIIDNVTIYTEPKSK
jgi:hypothetical protein